MLTKARKKQAYIQHSFLRDRYESEKKLFTLLTHDNSGESNSNQIIKFTDDMTGVSFIKNNDASANMNEVMIVAAWCKCNNLSLLMFT